MPKIPAMLETRFVPSSGPSFKRRSPDGRSTTSVCEEGEDGEVKAYCAAEAWTLISRNGKTLPMFPIVTQQAKRQNFLVRALQPQISFV